MDLNFSWYDRMYTPLVSILINNYNYGRFLRPAIESALGQRYPLTEVVVVDDGSTDMSREIIASYGESIIPIFKENGGQGSALNAGVAASRGEILCFLDADDLFHPEKATRVVEFYEGCGLNSRPIMMHHLLAIKNVEGEDLGGPPCGRTHASPLNLYDFATLHGFVWFESGPTSTISLNRMLADRLFPIPQKGTRISADDFVASGAFLLGEGHSLPETLGSYRVHGANNWHGTVQRRSPDFAPALQTYLNAKLVEIGLAPVISIENSARVWPDLVAEHRWAKLAWNMLKVCVRDHDRYTFTYAYHTIMTIGMIIMKAIRQKRDALLTLFDSRPAL
jgi:glycosyltransferase involved in cell wall biosynthesis